ncbi:MAG: phospholipase D family protein [Gammaproteobacteria bacterium]|nr:MAG: phospholipase D family protein [Gammaproteobacteria bacterium]
MMKAALRMALASSLLLAASGCTTVQRDPNTPVSHALPPAKNSPMAQRIQEHLARHPGQDAVHPLANGRDALVGRAVLAELATHSIDLQYYLYHADEVGALFTDALLKAADRGVRVRMLIDDIDLGGRDEAILALDAHPNIEIRLFNPLRRGLPRGLQLAFGVGTTTRRMHNKSFTVDGLATVLGGRNIGNEYFEADPALAFVDLDVMAIGPVVAEAEKAFDLYWNSRFAVPVTQVLGRSAPQDHPRILREVLYRELEKPEIRSYVDALHHSQLADSLRTGGTRWYWGKAQLVVDDPEKVVDQERSGHLLLKTQLKEVFDDLKKDLLIVSPYFVPGREGVEFLAGLVQRGVRVRIITNSLASNDVAIVHAGYARYRKALLRAGVELYEMNRNLPPGREGEGRSLTGSSRASLHAKTFLLDRHLAFVGSLNLDPRSLYENTEIGLLFDSPELGRDMANSLEANLQVKTFHVVLVRDDDGSERLEWRGIENGRPVVYDHDPHSSLWLRIGVNLLRILPIESQL